MTSGLVALSATLSLNTSTEGPDGAPWIMLSNSLGTNLSLWDAFTSAVKDRYRVLRYDQRGHGRSPAMPPPYTMPQLAEDLIALMDRLGIARAHVVGISMGGATGWEIAHRHPDRLLSATICDAAVAAGPGGDWAERLKIVHAAGALDPLVEPTLARWFTSKSMAENTEAVRRVREMIRTTSVDGFTGCVNALQTFDCSQGLESIKTPILLVAGEADGVRPKSMAEDAARVPAARLAIIPNAGHLCNIENPAAFNGAVAAFIDEVAAR